MIGKRRLILNHGINDNKDVIFVNNQELKSYKKWRNMLCRCYCKKFHIMKPNYIGCSVCDEWLLFSTFKSWYDKYYIEGWALDKDLLVKGNKVYSPQTCCFLPLQINTFLINHQKYNNKLIGASYDKRRNIYKSYMKYRGKQKFLGYCHSAEEAHKKYKVGREEYAKELAEEFKDKLDIRAYNALINYKEE